MLKKIINTFKKAVAPKTTNLLKHHIHFTTVDGVKHTFTGVAWMDPEVIRCSCSEYYLIGEKFMKDDNGVHYPMENVLSIEFEPVDYKENVIVKDRYKVFYQLDEIEIYEKGLDKQQAPWYNKEKKEIKYEIFLDDDTRNCNGNEFNSYNVIMGWWNNLKKVLTNTFISGIIKTTKEIRS